jgi:hypothetical protein
MKTGFGYFHTTFDRLSLVIILVSILASSFIYLWPSMDEFPMDDTYIHFVYAKNLSEQGQLFFNDNSEKGVGTSSILWVLLLAAGDRIGLSFNAAAKTFGILSLAVLGAAIYQLLRPINKPTICLAASLLVVLSGHMLWFALSGMETVLFLALGILILLCYRDEQWVWVGILSGLLFLTRVEGIFLCIVIGVFDILRHRTVRFGLLKAGVICAVLGGSWVLYLFLRTGYLLPTSGVGKHFSQILSIQLAQRINPSYGLMSRFPALTYPIILVLYTLEFALGGGALPAPYIHIDPKLGAYTYQLSVWAIVGWIFVVLPLFWIAARKVFQYLKMPGWQLDSGRLPLIILLIWTIVHNIGYMMYLPIIGTAGRYAAMNYIAIWIALMLGISSVRRPGLKLILFSGVLFIFASNTVYWNKVYDANIEHMEDVRIAAAKSISDDFLPAETCAASDVGAVRYFSQRPIVDLGGLINPELIQWYLNGELDRYLDENKVTCLVLPGRPGVNMDGVFDIAKEMGLSGSTLFSMREQQIFQVDHQRWLDGNLAVINYQASVTVYRLEGRVGMRGSK